MATMTTTTLGTSNMRGTSRQTRINPARTSRTNRPNLRQNSLISNPPALVPTASEPQGFYPAVSHFTDAIAALPRDFRRHTSLLKEVDAKAWSPEESLQSLLSRCLVERQTQTVHSAAQTAVGSSVNTNEDTAMLSATNSVNGTVPDNASQYSSQSIDPAHIQRRQMYASLRHNLVQMMVTMDEKNHVINNANEDLSKHIRRLVALWPHIANEISEEARLGSLKHWAYTETNPTAKKTPAAGSRREAAASLAIMAENDIAHRSESRREAMLAKKRLNQHVDSDFDDKGARKLPANSKGRKTGEAISEIPAAAGATTGTGKRKKPEKVAGGVGMERSVSGARLGSIAMSREPSQQDNIKKRKAPTTAATTAARKRLNAALTEEFESYVIKPIGHKRPGPKQTFFYRNAALRELTTLNNSDQSRPQSSASKSNNGANANTNETNNAVAATGRSVNEVKNSMRETTTATGDKLVQEERPRNNEPPMRGAVLLERTTSKQNGSKKDTNKEEVAKPSPRLAAALNVHEPKSSRGRASKTSTPVVGTFAEAEAEESANGNASETGASGTVNSKPKRAPRPRMKDHHGLHDSLSPKGLPMKRTHAKNASFSSLNAVSQLASKPTSRARDREQNNDTEEAPSTTSRSTSRNNHNTSQSLTQVSASASSTSQPINPARSIRASPSDIESDTNDVKGPPSPENENENNDEPENENDNENEEEEVDADADGDGDGDGDGEGDDELRYCYCNGVSYGEMVACDNPRCRREWFHLECLGLKSLPKSVTWFCEECR